MIIAFYKYTGEARTVNKVLANRISKQGHIKAGTAITDPVINMAYDAALLNCNYVYIEEFKRYFYITDITLNQQLMTISLHVDVLMSFKSDILQSKATIIRSNTGYNMISDNLVLQTPKVTRQVQKIGNSFTQNERLVLQLGG